ncbi:MAG: hypothetical protein IJD88_03735 [Clostridia bacterium]|nr:hypothetical protein [Clostridia bacterium]
MNNFEDNTRINPRGVEINFGNIFRVAMKKWWAILLAMIVAAFSFTVVIELLTKDTYTSKFSFITNNKSSYSEEYRTNSDVSASITMANTFKYILSGRTLKEAVIKEMDNKITIEQLEKYITVQTVTDTSIIEMKVTTNDMELTKSIAKAVEKHYKKIADEKYPDTSLIMCDAPSMPKEADKGTSPILIAVIGAIFGAVIVIICLLIVDVT